MESAMRVTQEVKRRTRARLIETAERLVRERGLDGVTTRDVAAEAGVAHGTLFGYFPSREAIGLALCDVLLARAAAEASRRRRDGASLEEDLFLHGASCLRRLKPLRATAGTLLAGVLAVADTAVDDGQDDGTPGNPLRVRGRLLDTVRDLVARHCPDRPASPSEIQLYASLFVGIVCWWSRDASPRQEDTLALLDHATRLFAASLGGAAGPREE
jgi:AcrR family transcriptional regulator